VPGPPSSTRQLVPHGRSRRVPVKPAYAPRHARQWCERAGYRRSGWFTQAARSGTGPSG
jgi:hypothetical protein